MIKYVWAALCFYKLDEIYFQNENDGFNGNYPWLKGLSVLHATNVNKTWRFNTSYTCYGLREIGNVQHK